MKDTYVRARVDKALKTEAESILASLGITMSQAIALDYQPSLDWLQGRVDMAAVMLNDYGSRDIIDRLFKLVPVTSMSSERLLEEDGLRMMIILLEAMREGYYLRDIQRASLEAIAADHPDGMMSRTKLVNVGGTYRKVARLSPQLDWIDTLINMDKSIALRYLGGLKIAGMGDYVQSYFRPLNDHPTLLEGVESQRALKFYKIFGWDQCKQNLDEHEAGQALEMDLGL